MHIVTLYILTIEFVQRIMMWALVHDRTQCVDSKALFHETK